MSELIKSVRVRPIEGSEEDLKVGRLDTKVSLFRDNRGTRSCIGYSISSSGDEVGTNWTQIEYQGRRYNDLSDDDIIKDYIRTNTLKERPREGEFVNLEGNQVSFYQIVQDPFNKIPPSERIYGSDPYYLNNGCKVFIRWYSSEKKRISWTFDNISTPDQTSNGIVSIQITTNEPNKPPLSFTYDSTNNPLQPGATPSYFNIESYWDFQSTSIASITSNDIVYISPGFGNTFIDTSSLISSGGKKYGSISNESYAIDGYNDNARDSITQSISIKPEGLVKTVEVLPPGDNEVWVISSKTDDFMSEFVPVYKKDLNQSVEIKYFSDDSYKGDFSKGQDWMILNSLISAWNKKIPNYNVNLSNPSFIENIEIEYKDPLIPIDDTVTEPEPVVEDNSKIKLNVSFDDNFQVKVREDSPEFRIVIGEPIDEDGFIFSGIDEEELDEEFREGAFVGEDESVFEEQDYPDEQTRLDTLNEAQLINSEPYVPGKYTLDLIPGSFLDNGKNPIRCCQIDGKPVNVKIADPLLDMIAAAKKDGINLIVNSGFRPGYGSSINAKSEKGVKVTADSQEVLWNKNCAGKAKCSPDTAKPGSSKHGSGLAIDFNTGTRTGANGISKMDSTKAKNYQWLVKNSWRFGFLRTVASEERHFEYWPQLAKKGPYAKLAKTNNLYYADLGINNLQIA